MKSEIEKAQVQRIEKHFAECYAIWHMGEKPFKKFYSAYMGESLNNEEIYEARLLLVKMLLQTLLNDCEVVLDEIKNERE